MSNIYSATWQPWVGKNIQPDSKHRILIIGESHYCDGTSESVAKHKIPSFTREVINEIAINKDYYQTRIFQNFHRAIAGHDDFDTEKFWNKVMFYNFIQEPMNTNKSRPSAADFKYGWQVFFGLVKVLQPTICLFIGNSAAAYFGRSIQLSEFKGKPITWNEKIGNSYAKSTVIEQENSAPIPLHFIRHTSQYFSWPKWNQYLKKTIPVEIDFMLEQ